ncbi:hypothetical protein D3C75_1328240 [compost metagenome]
MLRREHLGTRLGQAGSVKLHRNAALGNRLQGAKLQLSDFSPFVRGLRPVTEPFDYIHMSYNII